MVVLRRAHQHWRDRIGVREVCEGLIVGRPRQSPEHQLGGARDPNGRVEAGLVVLVSDLERIQLILVRVLPHAIEITYEDYEPGFDTPVSDLESIQLILVTGSAGC